MKYDYQREDIEENGDLEFFGEHYHYNGWKARAIVYLIMAGIVLIGILPWIWGVVSIFKTIF